MVSIRTTSAKVQVLASFVAVTFVLGIIFRSVLIFAGVPALVYLGLLTLQSQPPGEIIVTRYVEKAQLFEDDTSKVRIRTINTSKRSIALVIVEESVPKELENDSPFAFSFSLKPRESRDNFYSIKASTFGVFSLGPMRTRCEDASGLNIAKSVISERSVVVILPRTTERLTHFKIKPRKTKPWPGEIVARKVGLGMDNYSIRQYIPGDSFRRINWRASAKFADDLLLNEQTAELGADTIIIIDARPASNLFSSSGDSLVKHSLRAAISISDKLLRDRNRVGLVTLGLDSDRIPPGYGRRQYNRLVLSLIRVKAGGVFTFENIPSYLKYFYPHLAQVVLISPLLDIEAFNASGEIAGSGYELLILSPNPIDFGPTKTNRRENDRTLKIARDLSLISRKTNLDHLRNAGAVILDWRKNDPLDFALSRNLRIQSRYTELAKRRQIP
jgi:uncharacterized protein (DUF58 family)